MSLPERGKVLFTATLVRGHIAKFHLPYLTWFEKQGWETWVAAKNDYSDGMPELSGVNHFIDVSFPRSPFSPGLVTAYHQLRDFFACEHFDIIHTHTPVGSVLTRLAARNARREGTRVIYTVHGLHFYDGAPLVNWVLWYPIEKVMTRLTDVLVTINQEDYERAKRFAHCRVEYVPGVGIDVEGLEAREAPKELRTSVGVPDDAYLLLSVGDLNRNKNHAVAIEALKSLPSDVHLVVCGDGPLRSELGKLADDSGVADRVHLLGFRNDVPELMHASDVLVFPSLREGLPVTVMEAMACGLPVVAARVRGVTPDLVTDGESGLLLDAPDAASVTTAVVRLRSETGLASKLTKEARKRVKTFSIDAALMAMAEVYESLV